MSAKLGKRSEVFTAKEPPNIVLDKAGRNTNAGNKYVYERRKSNNYNKHIYIPLPRDWFFPVRSIVKGQVFVFLQDKSGRSL